MEIEIDKKVLLVAVENLKKKKPFGKNGKLFLTGSVGLSFRNDAAIFAIGAAESSCSAKGEWSGEVVFPFQIALAILKVPPKTEVIKIHFSDRVLQFGPLKVEAYLNQLR